MSDTVTQAQEAAPAAQAAPAITTDQQTANGQAQEAGAALSHLPAEAQTMIAELRRENAAHRRAKADAEKAAQAADERRLAEEKRFQELAEQRANRIAELEPIADRYAALAAKLSADLEKEIAKLPAELREMRPSGADLDSLIEWTEKARTLATKMQAAQATGAGPLPKPAGNPQATLSQQAETIAAMRARF